MTVGEGETLPEAMTAGIQGEAMVGPSNPADEIIAALDIMRHPVTTGVLRQAGYQIDQALGVAIEQPNRFARSTGFLERAVHRYNLEPDRKKKIVMHELESNLASWVLTQAIEVPAVATPDLSRVTDAVAGIVASTQFTDKMVHDHHAKARRIVGGWLRDYEYDHPRPDDKERAQAAYSAVAGERQYRRMGRRVVKAREADTRSDLADSTV